MGIEDELRQVEQDFEDGYRELFEETFGGLFDKVVRSAGRMLAARGIDEVDLGIDANPHEGLRFRSDGSYHDRLKGEIHDALTIAEIYRRQAEFDIARQGKAARIPTLPQAIGVAIAALQKRLTKQPAQLAAETEVEVPTDITAAETEVEFEAPGTDRRRELVAETHDED